MRRPALRQTFIAFLALPLFVCLSCMGLRAQETGNIVGQIRLQDGLFPAERILVTLEARGITVNSTYCDNEGRFYFYNLLANPYRVTIDVEEFQPVRQTVYVNPTTSQNTFVRMILRPREKQQPSKPSDAASGGNPYLANPTEYLKKSPREAVKEFEAGVKSEQQGKTEEAIRHYQKAISIAPDFYPARNNLGAKYLSKGEFQAAENEFTQVIKLNPNDAQAYFNLGNVLYLTKRYKEAAGTLQEGLRKQPISALGHHLFGAVQIRLGELSEAERSLRAALELDPVMPQTYLELANLYLLQQRRNDTIRQLKSFVELFPHDPMTPKVKEVLKKLEGQNPLPQ